MAINPALVTTVRTGDLPTSPFSLTDKIAHEVGTDLKQSTLSDLIAFLSPLISAIQYQVITLHVPQSYIDANFIMTAGVTKGLGINLMSGYAIVNGNNGTINKDGRVGIAYGEVTNVIGQVGGSDDAVIGAHTHNFIASDDTYGSGGTVYPAGTFMASAGNSLAGGSQSKYTESTGVSVVGANRQKFLVELQVMKL